MSPLAIAPQEILKLFRDRFRSDAAPLIYRAPGRVNLIGEHTDYNLGFVFPIALEMACYVAIAPAKHNQLRIYSRDLEDEFAIDVDRIKEAEPSRTWSDYAVGVARELAGAGIAPSACDLLVSSDVPVGSGLSSSAAFEISIAFALLGSRQIAPLDIALLGHGAEKNFVGIPSGIMDQYAAVFGREGSAIQIDCRNLQHEYVPVPQEVNIIAVNSMVKHSLASSSYRERVSECHAAVAAIQRTLPNVKSLRDVSLETFEKVQENIPPVPRKRARHVVSENQRVLDFAAAARAHDLEAMGRLFLASHRSMQHDYEVSCEEIDFLVDTAIGLPGVYGARMTGGGFGGCTVNLVDPPAADSFREKLGAAYQARFHKTPAFYDCKASNGAGPVDQVS
jgi:galactokinase